MNGHEPRWDHDLEYGKQGELRTVALLEYVAKGNGRAETKTKSRIDDVFYVECWCRNALTGEFQPSGLAVTEAELWVFQLHDTGIAVVIPATLLKETIRQMGPGRKLIEQPTGDHPTKGYLISFRQVLRVAASLT